MRGSGLMQVQLNEMMLECNALHEQLGACQENVMYQNKKLRINKRHWRSTHKGHRDQNKMFQFHGRRQMLQSNFD
jgi:hypothetical protein